MPKRTLIIILISLFLISLSSFAFAIRGTEVRYPRLPGNTVILPTETLPLLSDYIKYVFNFTIWIAGLIVFGSFVYAGVRYVTSAGNPSKLSDAKDRMFNSVLGLVVLLSAYLILTTVNPQLVILSLGIEAKWGIVVYKEPGCPVGGEEGKDFLELTKDTSELGDFKDNVKSIEFKSPRGMLDLLIYPMQNYLPEDGFIRLRSEDVTEVTYNGIKKQCVTLSDDTPVKSIKFDWKLPGVYLINAQGEEKFLPADTALLEKGFNDNITHIRLNSEGELKFGAVLHNAQDYKEPCRVLVPEDYPFTKEEIDGLNYEHRPIGIVSLENENKSVALNELVNMGDLGVSSVTVFNPVKKDQASGEGVYLCTNDNFGGECFGPFATGLYELVTNYGIPSDQITSIKIEGNYLAVLFDGAFDRPDALGNGCQVFTKSDANLRDDEIGRCKCGPFGWGCGDCLSSFIIIPTK